MMKYRARSFPVVVVMLGFACGDDGGASSPDAAAGDSFLIASSPSAIATAAVAPGSAFVGSPTEFHTKMFAAYVSASTDCSNPILVQDYGATPHSFDVTQSPTLFSGSPPDGTYPCLVVKLVDVFSFKPDAAAVAANAACESTDTLYTFDTYREGGEDDGLWESLDGTNIDATGTDEVPGEDTTFTFFSTDVAAIRAANGDMPHQHQKLALDSALVVPGAATMYMDFSDGLGEEGGKCAIVGGSIGFR